MVRFRVIIWNRPRTATHFNYGRWVATHFKLVNDFLKSILDDFWELIQLLNFQGESPEKLMAFALQGDPRGAG